MKIEFKFVPIEMLQRASGIDMDVLREHLEYLVERGLILAKRDSYGKILAVDLSSVGKLAVEEHQEGRFDCEQ